MELGDPAADQHAERGRLDVVLDRLNDDFAELVEAVEAGALEQLDAAAKVALWHRVETFRNRLPLIDYALIADAEATDGCMSLSSVMGMNVIVNDSTRSYR